MIQFLSVLVVDDSSVYRSGIRSALEKIKGVEVIGTASTGKIAIQKLLQHKVDLVILDLEMPEMDGIETLVEIKKRNLSHHIMMFSAISKSSAERTLDAIKLGARDFIPKPGSNQQGAESPTEKIYRVLEPKVRQLYEELYGRNTDTGENTMDNIENESTYTQVTEDDLGQTERPKVNLKLLAPKAVVIGSSTGGPNALEKLFATIRGPIPFPIFIAQHMPPVFTAALAERLERISGIATREGRDRELALPNHVYVAPGDYHMTLERISGIRIKLNQDPPLHSVRPAVDPLFESAASIYKSSCVGIILTGMGQDGTRGAQLIKKNNGGVMIQSKESCVVFGMPGAAFNKGAYDRIGSLEEIAETLKIWSKNSQDN